MSASSARQRGAREGGEPCHPCHRRPPNDECAAVRPRNRRLPVWASYQGNVAGGRSPPRLNRSIGVGLGLILVSPTLREPIGDLEPRGYASRARLPVAMRALDGDGPFAAPASTHPEQPQPRRQRRPNVHSPFAWPSTSHSQRRSRRCSPGIGMDRLNSPSTHVSVGGITSSAPTGATVSNVSATAKVHGAIRMTMEGTSSAREHRRTPMPLPSIDPAALLPRSAARMPDCRPPALPPRHQRRVRDQLLHLPRRIPRRRLLHVPPLVPRAPGDEPLRRDRARLGRPDVLR